MAVADVCGSESWSPIASAGAQSVMSGVLAGFMFLGMVAIWTADHPDPDEDSDWPQNRSYALELFAAGFVIFAVDSYLSSITSGELVCFRAEAESAFSGGVLGIGAVVMVAGLAWLLVSLSEQADELISLLRWILSGLGVLIIVMLCVSSQGVGQALTLGRWQGFVDWAPLLIAGVLASGVFAICWRTARVRPASVKRTVHWACVLAFGDAIVSAVLTGVIGALAPSVWIRVSAPLVYGIVVASMVMPGVVLLVAASPAVSAVVKKHPERLVRVTPLRHRLSWRLRSGPAPTLEAPVRPPEMPSPVCRRHENGTWIHVQPHTCPGWVRG